MKDVERSFSSRRGNEIQCKYAQHLVMQLILKYTCYTLFNTLLVLFLFVGEWGGWVLPVMASLPHFITSLPHVSYGGIIFITCRPYDIAAAISYFNLVRVIVIGYYSLSTSPPTPTPQLAPQPREFSPCLFHHALLLRSCTENNRTVQSPPATTNFDPSPLKSNE